MDSSEKKLVIGIFIFREVLRPFLEPGRSAPFPGASRVIREVSHVCRRGAEIFFAVVGGRGDELNNPWSSVCVCVCVGGGLIFCRHMGGSEFSFHKKCLSFWGTTPIPPPTDPLLIIHFQFSILLDLQNP